MSYVEPCKKKAYRDFRVAHKALAKIKTGQKREFTPTRAYRCEDCGMIHLSHHERQHWLKNVDFRSGGTPATEENIQKRIDFLTQKLENEKI